MEVFQVIPFLALVIAYLLGSIPFGYLLVKWRTGSDVRASGSGNIGATNVLRTTGRIAGAATLLLDIAKGYVAVRIAEHLGAGSPFWMSAAALAVMAGHSYPLFLKFRGGKAVATFIGAFFGLTPVPLVAVVVVFLGVAAWTRQVSMGSIVAAATFPLAAWLVGRASWPVLTAAILAAAFVIYRHSSNIQRLRSGSERTFSFGAKRL